MFDELEGTLNKIDRNTADSQSEHISTRNLIRELGDWLTHCMFWLFLCVVISMGITAHIAYKVWHLPTCQCKEKCD